MIRQHFGLFDEFAQAVRGWELDFYQLGKADAPYYLEQLAGPSIMISRGMRFLDFKAKLPDAHDARFAWTR